MLQQMDNQASKHPFSKSQFETRNQQAPADELSSILFPSQRDLSVSEMPSFQTSAATAPPKRPKKKWLKTLKEQRLFNDYLEPEKE